MDGQIKSISTDEEFRNRHGISSANSINWGRIAAQCVHWFHAYFSAVKALGQPVGSEVDFAVPTGAMGNVTAGFTAKLMGFVCLCLLLDGVSCGEGLVH